MVATINHRAVRFVVCGVGRIGMRHATIIREYNGAELVATVDVDDANKVDEVPHFTSLADFIASGIEADVVSIATPNGLHAAQSVEALKAGFHVLIEKPIALHKADAEEVIHTALQHNRLVFGVMQNRYSPPSQWLKSLIDNGTLGEVYMVNIQCYWNRDERYYQTDKWHGSNELDGGTLFTQFSHFVDLFYWLFGDIKNISGRFANFNHQSMIEFEDSGMVHFDFVKGGKGSLQYSTSVWDANMESSISILAENGSVKVAGQYMNEVVYCHVKDYQMPVLPPSNPPNNYGPYKGSAANHGYVIENVVNTLKGETTITTNAMEGLKVVEIIERIYKTREL